MEKLMERLKQIQSVLLILVMLAVSSCGYFIYPERRNQTEGQIDGMVVLMDGVCCLFFLLPGIIAFAVDFSSGAIYLPSGSKNGSKGRSDEVAVIRVPKNEMTLENIARIVERETGRAVDLTQANVRVYEIDSPENLPANFYTFNPAF